MFVFSRLRRTLTSELPGTPVRGMVGTAAAICIVSAWFNRGFFSHDEHFQILEFAWYKLGRTPVEGLAWEFGAQMRPALQPFLAAGLFRILDALGWFTPFFAAFLLRLISGLLGLWISLELCIRVLPWVRDTFFKRLLLAGMLFLWFLPYTHGRFASENWGGLLFFGGLCLLLDATNAPSDRRAVLRTTLAGLAWGAAFYCRFQMGFAIAGAGLWLVFVRRARLRTLTVLAASFALAGALNIALDHWLYGAWVNTPYNYFHANLVEGKAAMFGTQPWWFYFAQMLALLVPPFSLVLVALLAAGVWLCRRNVLVWAVVPFLAGHTVLGHKEIRFLIPITYAIVPLLILAADKMPASLRAWASGWRRRRVAALAVWIFVALNTLALLVMTFKPSSETAIVYEWLYAQSRDAPIVLYTGSRLPYSMGSYEVNFYRPGNIRVRNVGNVEELRAAIANGHGRVFLFQPSFRPPLWAAQNRIGCTPVVRTLPSWVSRINVNNWTSRMYVWTVFSLGTPSSTGC
jgi:phosphatidylinositol glycan class B